MPRHFEFWTDNRWWTARELAAFWKLSVNAARYKAFSVFNYRRVM